ETSGAYERLCAKFYVEACDDGSVDVLAIDRVSTEMTLTVRQDVPASAETRPICGLMGTIRLVAGKCSMHTVWRYIISL
uniref:Uncharacterized protein n=1 Tax=Neolamprologus brichardi TaxID=32507 RepID=A0A3Q4I6E4_NEOBR